MSRKVFLDANVVLRILFGEPAELAEHAFRAVVRLREEGARLILPGIALAEVVWTLERRAKVARVDIAAELLDFLTAFGIAVEDRVWLEALALYGERNVPFGDAVLATAVQAAADAQLLSFDEEFDRLPVRRLRPEELSTQAVGEPGPARHRKPRRRG